MTQINKERQVKDKVVKLLKQCLKQQKSIKIVFGDLESESVIINGLEYALDSIGRYTLGLDLIISNPTRKTIFVASPILSIFVEDFKIVYASWSLQCNLKYLEANNVYRLSITSGEYGVIDERKEDEGKQ